jgi:hypothetical protein
MPTPPLRPILKSTHAQNETRSLSEVNPSTYGSTYTRIAQHGSWRLRLVRHMTKLSDLPRYLAGVAYLKEKDIAFMADGCNLTGQSQNTLKAHAATDPHACWSSDTATRHSASHSLPNHYHASLGLGPAILPTLGTLLQKLPTLAYGPLGPH